MKLRRFRKARLERGLYLIEMMIGIGTTALLGAALVAALAETQRLSSSSQNQVEAADIAQELIDNARNLTFTQLVGLVGTYTWTNTYSICTGCSGSPSPDPRPLMMDTTNLHWTTYAGQPEPYGPAYANQFNGTVTETIALSSPTNTQYVTVTVTSQWNDGSLSRSYSQSALISIDGIHNYE